MPDLPDLPDVRRMHSAEFADTVEITRERTVLRPSLIVAGLIPLPAPASIVPAYPVTDSRPW